MKNFTPARQKLKELGWNRCDRASGPNISDELWCPPWDGIGFSPQSVSFRWACKKAGIIIKKEDRA